MLLSIQHRFFGGFMRRQFLLLAIIAGFATGYGQQANAHHSNVAFGDKTVTLSGVVKAFAWQNPHVQLFILVDDGKGGKVEWRCETRPPGQLLKAGYKKDSLKPGEKVTVELRPAKDGSNFGALGKVVKEDGTVLSGAVPPVE